MQQTGDNASEHASYLRFYERYSYRAVARFTFDAMLTRNRLRRLSLLNRQRDYLALSGKPELLALHRRVHAHLLSQAVEWPSYDYGEGYFYQSLETVGVTGLRDTRARVEAMDLRTLVAGKRVLDVGCNSGFVALSVAEVATEVAGFDINPHLVQIAREAAVHMGLANTRFEARPFEGVSSSGTYDAVLSFANHSTYDGNTQQTIEQYFRKCGDLLVPGGLLLFESHAPDYEGEGLAGVLEILGRLFTIRRQQTLSGGTFLDRGRTFVVA